MREGKRIGMTVAVVALVVAEVLFFSKRGYLAEYAQTITEGDLIISILAILIIGAGIVIANILITYGILFKLIYFGEKFESSEDQRTEGGKGPKLAAWLSGILFAAMTVWALLG